MKKSLLLIALPALLALSACGNAQRKANQDNFDYFKEDTIAHEELLGGGQLAPQRLGNPEENPEQPGGQFTLTPKVGVQFTSYEENEQTLYAVRYVAAVSLTSLEGVTAEWKRAVSDKDGNQVKVWSGEHFSTELYESLNNGGSPKAATSETGGEFKNYLVYSMYDIPASQINSYIAAYLTLSDGAHEVVSKVVAARIGNGNAFSFAANKAEGYFIQGRINGVANTILNLDDDPTEATDHAEEKDVSLKEDDEFGCFYYGQGTSFKFFGYDNNVGTSVSDYYLEQSGSTKYFKLRASATYTLTMTDADSLAISDPAHPTVTLYFHPGSNWRASTPKFALWYNSAFHPFVIHDAGSNMYKLEDFPFNDFYSNLVFTRHNASIDGHTWDWDNNLWGKTADQTYPRDDRPNKRVANVYDEDWGGKDNDPARVSWTVLS